MRGMEGEELGRGSYRCVAGEKGQMVSPPECVCESELMLETCIWVTKPSS